MQSASNKSLQRTLCIKMNPQRFFKMYYLSLPIFLLIELIIASRIRVMLPEEYLSAYYAYYLISFVLGGFIFTGSLNSLIYGVVESTLSIFILISSVMISVMSIASNPEAASYSFGLNEVVNFILVGSVLVYGFNSVVGQRAKENA